jgi:hypothetical protein
MSNRADRDWIDITAKLMIPVVIAGAGAWYTWHKDNLDLRQRQWDRDSGVMRLLVSSNDHERLLALKTIEVLKREGQFSKDLNPVVDVVALDVAEEGRRPSDPATQTAKSILSKETIEGKSAAPPPDGAPQNAAREVYIQIGHAEQKARAMDLQAALQKSGFRTPDIELVPHATFHTYVRYFDAEGIPKANEIQKLMASLGFKSEVQDFSKGQPPGPEALEVWIGDKEPAQGPSSAH